jgi:hypothetical protein
MNNGEGRRVDCTLESRDIGRWRGWRMFYKNWNNEIMEVHDINISIVRYTSYK